MAFGIEHGNEGFRKKMLDRRWKNGDIIKATNVPKKLGIQFSVNNITGFPNETRKLAFDTIELNRQIESDNQNIYSFVPFHGTPLRILAEKMGLISHEIITKCLTNKPQIVLPEFLPEEIEGFKRCFPLYVKFPRNRWKEIEKAEKLDEEGNRIYSNLKSEHIEKYFPKPEEDLTGKGDPDKIPQVSDDIKRGYADELN
jgi:radical SAM superfamily enzyme